MLRPRSPQDQSGRSYPLGPGFREKACLENPLVMGCVFSERNSSTVGPCVAAASATVRRTECRDHPGPAERASSWRMASQPPLEPASAQPPSSLASFLKAATRGSPAVEPHLRRIVQERLESKYACTVNSLYTIRTDVQTAEHELANEDQLRLQSPWHLPGGSGILALDGQ